MHVLRARMPGNSVSHVDADQARCMRGHFHAPTPVLNESPCWLDSELPQLCGRGERSADGCASSCLSGKMIDGRGTRCDGGYAVVHDRFCTYHKRFTTVSW
ncbi:hypothetical protein MRB53_041027 [Persea americana]|nr:hypothetical protein MRB53_041027 [Persea americana]